MLERKVEELLAQKQSEGNNSQRKASGTLPDIPTSSATSSWTNSSDTFDRSTRSTPHTSLSGDATHDFVERGLMTLETAQILLNRFQPRATQEFSFVMIPSSTTLHSLRHDTAFLFLAVAAAMAFDNPPLQMQLGNEFREQTFRRILYQGEKSLELLQGLLIYAAWYSYFHRRNENQISLFSQLCVSLVYDLGLEKCDCSQQQDKPSLRNTKMRALLGTYYLSCA
jgi:hypothetical protein